MSICLPFSFHFFLQPGLYAIVNNSNNKRYIGETDNLAGRLAGHFKTLNSNRSHDCTDLQQDWNTQNGQNFSFEILEIGSQWSEKTVRLQKEREIALSLERENVYNFYAYIDYRAQKIAQVHSFRRNSISVIANGVQYSSISVPGGGC